MPTSFNFTDKEVKKLQQIINSKDPNTIKKQIKKQERLSEFHEMELEKCLKTSNLNILCSFLSVNNSLANLNRLEEQTKELNLEFSIENTKAIGLLNEMIDTENTLNKVTKIVDVLKELDVISVCLKEMEEGDIFLFTKNILKLERKIVQFEEYKFYEYLHNFYVKKKDKLIFDIMRDSEVWFKNLKTINYDNLGTKLLELYNNFESDENNSVIFDKKFLLKEKINFINLLNAVYASEKLKIENEFFDNFNNKRINFIYESKNIKFNYLIGFFTIEFYLKCINTKFDLKTKNTIMLRTFFKSIDNLKLEESFHYYKIYNFCNEFRIEGLKKTAKDEIISDFHMKLEFYNIKKFNNLSKLCHDLIKPLQYLNMIELNLMLLKKVDNYLLKYLKQNKNNDIIEPYNKNTGLFFKDLDENFLKIYEENNILKNLNFYKIIEEERNKIRKMEILEIHKKINKISDV